MANAILNFHFDFLNPSLRDQDSRENGKYVHFLLLIGISGFFLVPGNASTLKVNTWAVADRIIHGINDSTICLIFWGLRFCMVRLLFHSNWKIIILCTEKIRNESWGMVDWGFGKHEVGMDPKALLFHSKAIPKRGVVQFRQQRQHTEDNH